MEKYYKIRARLADAFQGGELVNIWYESNGFMKIEEDEIFSGNMSNDYFQGIIGEPVTNIEFYMTKINATQIEIIRIEVPVPVAFPQNLLVTGEDVAIEFLILREKVRNTQIADEEIENAKNFVFQFYED